MRKALMYILLGGSCGFCCGIVVSFFLAMGQDEMELWLDVAKFEIFSTILCPFLAAGLTYEIIKEEEDKE